MQQKYLVANFLTPQKGPQKSIFPTALTHRTQHQKENGIISIKLTGAIKQHACSSGNSLMAIGGQRGSVLCNSPDSWAGRNKDLHGSWCRCRESSEDITLRCRSSVSCTSQIFHFYVSIVSNSYLLLRRMIRNVAIVGHSHSGKTSLGEWMLYDEKVLTKQPLAGQSLLDSDPAESSRHSSVFSHFLRVPHNDHLLELVDTPWHDFQSDANSALDGSDAAIIVASVCDGLKPGTITSFKECQEKKVKSILCLSKMDREFIDVDNFMEEFEATLGVKPVPLQVRVHGKGDEFEGVKPLFLLKANGDIVKNDEPGTEDAWKYLEESVAMTDDDLLMEYLDDGTLSSDKVLLGLKTAIRKQKILPAVFTSSEQNVGVIELMDSIIAFLPDPVEAREEALQAACESEGGMCGMKPGVEAGFAARVVHTVVDSFGSLSILRVISNSCDGGGNFDSIPHNVVNMRTGEDIKIGLTAFTLQGKERLAFPTGAKVLPGNVIAIPKLDSVQTNDILTVKEAVSEEAAEIQIEEETQVLTPLSRRASELPLMYTALVSLPEADGKKGGKGKTNSGSDKLISALHAIAREDLAGKIISTFLCH